MAQKYANRMPMLRPPKPMDDNESCVSVSCENNNLKRMLLSVHSGDFNSRRSGSAATPAKFTVTFPSINNVRRIRLMTTEIPNSQNVIRTGVNDSLDFVDAAATLTATIPAGVYTMSTLATAVQTAMDAAAGGAIYTVTANVDTGKITITKGGAFSLLIASGPHADTISTVDGRRISHGGIFRTLGFDTLANQAAVVTATADQIVDLSGEPFIYLCISGMQTMRATDGTSDIFAKIIMDTAPSFFSYNNFISNDLVYMAPKDRINELEVSFRNRDGTLVDFQAIDTSFTLEFTYES
jgi:hypothetical protein